MSPKRNPNPNKNGLEELFIVEEEEVNSIEGKIQGDKNISNTNEKDEFRIFFWIMLKGMHDISHNIIQLGK